MKKWAGPLLSLFLVVIFFLIYSPFHIFKQKGTEEGKVNPVRNSSGALNPAGIILKSNPAAEQRGIISNGVKEPQIVQTQNTGKEEKKEETDPHLILILKQLREKLDGWLKSLNERIEREDVTRLEVRFLEILRNILEWVREKIDSKIESSEKKQREKERPFEKPI